VTAAPERYPFVERDPGSGAASLAPLLPITLVGARPVTARGLLDTGAAVNVLPYTVGQQTGAVWEEQTSSVTFSGNLAGCEARVLIPSALVGAFPAVRLAFACAKSK
jgi:hypothetical protein